MWHNIIVLIATLFVVSLTHWVYRWRNPKCNGKLPPGSMGWPLLGETLQFFAPNRTWDTPPFIRDRMKRYGSIFRTSIVGMKVIVSTDSNLNYKIFQQEGLFQSWYPNSMTKVFGEHNLSTLQGYLHKYTKNMVLNLVGYETLKNMLSEVESAATTTIQRWETSQEIVELKAGTANLVFGLTAKKLISYDLQNSSENLRENFDAFMEVLISVPIAIPGTSYRKCVQGSKKAMKMLKNMLEERRTNPNKSNCDYFDYVLEELKKDDTILTEEIALDLMFLLLFASYETTSTAMLVAVKLLTDNPQALKELTDEHEKIIKNRENPDSGLTWEEYKSMKFTFQV
ncbi:cytochrome P450 87A3-like [Rutidosis leptorrhynchoides]|uniref:cytochrome P450 87A3-like n=1 Tax=Rutidosis leptorrhynchoides TaxID=125765 RepID=UPI003A99E21A